MPPDTRSGNKCTSADASEPVSVGRARNLKWNTLEISSGAKRGSVAAVHSREESSGFGRPTPSW